jgi:polyphosphate kinase
LVQIKRETHIRSLNQILEESFNNQFTHWQMDEDDKWRLHKENKSNSDYQEFFIETITEGARND